MHGTLNELKYDFSNLLLSEEKMILQYSILFLFVGFSNLGLLSFASTFRLLLQLTSWLLIFTLSIFPCIITCLVN